MPNRTTDIAHCIEQNLHQYFRTLDGEPAANVYGMVLRHQRPARLGPSRPHHPG